MLTWPAASPPRAKRSPLGKEFGGLLALLGVGAFILINVNGGNHASGPSSANAVVAGTIRVPDNLDVTLDGVDLSAGDSVDIPKTGNEYAVTHWTFHNFRDSNTDVADFGFTVESNGVITDPEFASSLTSNELGSSGTTLAPGASISRDIVFQVSRGATAKVIYKPADFTAYWTLSG